MHAASRFRTNLMAGLMETLAAPPYNGRADLPALAGALQMELDDLFPMAETLQLLRFAELEEGDIYADRRAAALSSRPTSTNASGCSPQRCVAHVPLVGQIRRVLDERWNHRAPAVRFRDELEDHMSPDYAEETLRTAISWGRYRRGVRLRRGGRAVQPRGCGLTIHTAGTKRRVDH